MMPISCVECRRRKIKCNKSTPCNQCIIKNRECEYPPKFRSIKVESLILDGIDPLPASETVLPGGGEDPDEDNKVLGDDVQTATIQPQPRPVIKRSGSSKGELLLSKNTSPERPRLSPSLSDKSSGSKRKADGSEYSAQAGDAESIIMLLRKENEALRLKLKDSRLKNKRERNKQDSDDNDTDVNYGNDNVLGTNPQTSGIYYGPNSTRFMISSSLTKSDVNEFDHYIKVKRQIKQKRELPILYNPPASSIRGSSPVPGSHTGASTPSNGVSKAKQTKNKTQENIKLIIALVNKFFHLRIHYLNYLEKEPLIEFLKNYQSAKNWKNDDDILLLVIMVIIVTLRSLPNTDPLMVEYKLEYETFRPSLYKQYKNLKNGLQVETTTSLRAYVLECEDLFYNDQIERSWASLFKTVSTAYSLGLHVYDENIVNTLKLEEHEKALDVVRDNHKASLWFVINFISATLCSVLGRPNPVTFNFQPLLRNYEIRLNYKIALAELVKKSTNVLIDSYKVQISFDTIMEIDEAFVNEALIYEKILIDTRIMRDLKSRDDTKSSFITLPVIDNKKSFKKGGKSNSFKSLSQLNLSKILNDCPLDIRFTILRPCPNYQHEEAHCLLKTDCDTLSDLILLYGNRAKFHQHFMSSFKKSLEGCLDSILKVLEHSLELTEQLIKKFHLPYFQQLYPFFYTFLYQTFVVMYTLMHLGYSKLSAYYNEIGLIRQKLIKLFDTVGLNNWRPNVVRIIQYINDMCDNFFRIYIEKELQQPSHLGRIAERPLEVSQGYDATQLNSSMSPVASPQNQLRQQLNLQQNQQPHEQQNYGQQIQQPQSQSQSQSQNQIYSQLRSKPTFAFGMSPINDSSKVSGNPELQLSTPNLQSMPSFTNIQLHNIPEHLTAQMGPNVPTPNQQDRHLTHSQAHHNYNHLNTLQNRQNQEDQSHQQPRQQQQNHQQQPPQQRSSASSSYGVGNGSQSQVKSDYQHPQMSQMSLYNNNSTSLSQVSLANYNLDYYNATQQMFPLPQSAQYNNNSTGENSDFPASFTIDPLLGFDLSDPFFVQNPSNFNYTAGEPDPLVSGTNDPGTLNTDGNRNDEDESVGSNNHIYESSAASTGRNLRPESTRLNSNESNEVLNYITRCPNSPSLSVERS
ncbi:hypothetical protein CANARDRAFT_26716 [[Candida] arabinofermentans NRRL YB-2248]|uniref:Zn(2)-C6 fungal-type domain-containing protein n=1 Tax=[Candida] arabinofermentans NRRL YB-2248 TaxID=983967 RepID=A0A1E4T6B5_9ASCO|nr:hypothetical protein CANARDRAFT_26716 [[Candida] arabinofermentans NRRL YB-2248]